MHSKIEAVEFKPLVEGLSSSPIYSALILSLAGKWWDTTHTFQFQHLGEITMTPIDFSAICGLLVASWPLKLDRAAHKKKASIVKYFGEPFGSQIGQSVTVTYIWKEYLNIRCKNPHEEEILVQGFIVAPVGSTLLARPNQRV